ncbi:hypothetical protein BLOT_014836 [Blomia tropicalis]|nr:hypothetical protein BLOT_014836 [Blomia tropicalis]
MNQIGQMITLTLFINLLLIIICLQTGQILTKAQLVHDCKSTPILRNVNEVRKFVDNCIKTKDGIRFRKRFPTNFKWITLEKNKHSMARHTRPVTRFQPELSIWQRLEPSLRLWLTISKQKAEFLS